MLLTLLLIIPPILLLGAAPNSPVPLIGMTSFGPPLLYAAGQIRLDRRNWWRRWAFLPLLTLLGMGVCLNNTLAVWQGWHTKGGEFQRTPKFRVEHAGDGWRGSAYRLPVDRMMIGELLMMCYAILAAVLIAQREGWLSAPFMLLYAASFGAVAGIGLWQGRPTVRAASASTQPSLPVRAASLSEQSRSSVRATSVGEQFPPLAVHAPSTEVLVKTTIAQVE
jgi:cytochrome bd-type quinol oxidase subunit 2